MREARVRAGAGALAGADLGVDQVNAVSAKPGGYEGGRSSERGTMRKWSKRRLKVGERLPRRARDPDRLTVPAASFKWCRGAGTPCRPACRSAPR